MPKTKKLNITLSYQTKISKLEEENVLLKQTLQHLHQELEHLKTQSLLLCQIHSFIQNKPLIQLPNNNQFLVSPPKTKEKLNPGDFILVEHRNLNIIKKLPLSQLLKIHFQNTQINFPLNQITPKFKNFSGPQIKFICQETKNIAQKSSRSFLTKKDFSQAFEKLKSLQELRTRDHQKMFG